MRAVLATALAVLAGLGAGGTANAMRSIYTAVKAEGPPATQNGAKLQTGTLAFLRDVADTFDRAARATQSLPTSSKKAFSKAGKAVIKTFESQINGFQAKANALSKYESKAIKDANSLTPSCSSGSLFGG